jgi:mono/diheme cytochrome c family protein
MNRSLACFAVALGVGFLAPPAGRAADAVDFNRDIRPILANNCFRCHGPDVKERKADLRLDTEDGAFADLGGHAAVVRGKPADSELIARVTATDPAQLMPPRKTGKKLTSREIDLLTRWIKQGAPYARHWAYVKPVRPPLPLVKNGTWPRNPIDSFILARLEREGLHPSPEADRYALVRRLSLDLTGLPPTEEEVEQFVRDRSPAAYEHLVDRLLDKPAYGEHWARLWLDLARYADSAGYADDPSRTIWAYRDYVIRAFNANKPFDQFTIEQLAGDLLPNPTEEQLLATAFHRNTMTNNEGGTSDEEFRNVAVVDRVNTTLAVWMGTSMACAQCHNHKYDPISQEEYFRFFAFLNNTEDADRRDESPLLSLFSQEQKQQRNRLEQEIAELEKVSPLHDPVAEMARRQVTALRKLLAGMKPATTVPILRELPAGQRRKTHIQFRGNFLDLGKEVQEGTPAAFPPLSKGAPLNRLTLARWLVDENNPLTARVIVNRYWEQTFGVGIVRTSEEFGTQGDLPTHPEMLDWLATELIRLKWDLKAFLKLLVTSATYRQSSRVTPELLEQDPENRLLSRGPRFRLSAEVVHDQALFVSGLLSTKMYGPPVRPPRPTSGLAAAFGSSIDWKTSDGEDRHRRGLYTEWRRSNPYPSMVTFDAPNREVCTLRRTRTNTPLQALVTLNDPVYVETAQALARRIARFEGSTPDRVRHGFRLCLTRPASAQEVERLVKLYQEAHAGFTVDREKALQIATNPLGPAPKEMAVADLAAWTIVANVLLNLDEMFMKR